MSVANKAKGVWGLVEFRFSVANKAPLLAVMSVANKAKGVWGLVEFRFSVASKAPLLVQANL